MPGQGAYATLMSNLKKLKIIKPLKEYLASNSSYFGICVGMQILSDWGYEDKILPLQEGKSYFLNTLKNHWVVSFIDGCLLLLLNIEPTPDACYWLWDKALGGRDAPKRTTWP